MVKVWSIVLASIVTLRQKTDIVEVQDCSVL